MFFPTLPNSLDDSIVSGAVEHTLHLDLPHRVTVSDESGEPPRRDRYSLKGTVHRKAKSWSTLEFPKESIKSHPLTIPWEFINNNRIYLDSKQSDREAPPEAQRTAPSALLCSPICKLLQNLRRRRRPQEASIAHAFLWLEGTRTSLLK